jgi:hypothetical protein
MRMGSSFLEAKRLVAAVVSRYFFGIQSFVGVRERVLMLMVMVLVMVMRPRVM